MKHAQRGRNGVTIDGVERPLAATSSLTRPAFFRARADCLGSGSARTVDPTPRARSRLESIDALRI